MDGKHTAWIIKQVSITLYEFVAYIILNLIIILCVVKKLVPQSFAKKNYNDCLILNNIIVSTSFLIFCSYLL